MDKLVVLASVLATCAQTRAYCVKTKLPLELGKWKHDLKQLDSTVVESTPVSMAEGQFYVYENYFPGYTIKYIHVDNLAVRTCGASATLKNGGTGTSTVMVILHADTNQEIRSVVDIWGVENHVPTPKKNVRTTTTTKPITRPLDMKNIKSRYLFKDVPAFNSFN